MFFFFFKQKTAYEMRISDWSSDVCSSDRTAPEIGHGGHAVDVGDPDPAPLDLDQPFLAQGAQGPVHVHAAQAQHVGKLDLRQGQLEGMEIGRASCRERVWQYV